MDVQTKCLLNENPYLVKCEMRQNDQNLGENTVHRVVEPYKNTGRNVTTDSFFTLLKLAECLRTNILSYVGTMLNRVKRSVPSHFKSLRNSVFSLKGIKHNIIYQGKINKNATLLDSGHSLFIN